MNDHEKHLGSLQTAQEQVKRDVLRFQERERHLKKVADLEKKKPWIEFEEQRMRALESKKLKDDAEEQLQSYDDEKRRPIREKMEYVYILGGNSGVLTEK